MSTDVVPLPGLAVANGAALQDDGANVFYANFRQLSDDILAGRHPTIRSALAAPPVVSVPAPSYRQPPPPQPVAQKNEFVARRDAAAQDAQNKRRQLEQELHASNNDQTDYEPFENIDEILAKAQVMLPGSKPKTTKTPSSDSFDENSYYSSQANSWSSDAKDKGEDAESEAMAISSDGESSEDEFEPAFEPAKDVPDETPWSNDVMAESDDDNYSPPAVPSPEYIMTVDSDRQSQQPQAISLNHIKSPLAPQPEHISPLAALQQQFERTDEPSRSEHERLHNSWRGKKGWQSGRSSPPRNGKQQMYNPKKRRHQGPEDMQRKQRRARSPQSPLIKQEEMTPPPFQPQPHSRQPSSHQRTPSGKGRQVAVPPGFKLVPINDEPAYVQPYQTYQLPATQAPRQPVLVDQHGNEFFAEPPAAVPMGYEVVPVQRVAPTYYERPPQRAATAYYQAEFDGAVAPPPQAHFALTPQQLTPRQLTPQQLMAPPPHSRTAVQSQPRYIERPATVEPQPPERAYSLRPTYVEARPEPQLVMPPLALPFVPPPPPPQFLQHLNQQHQLLQQQQQQQQQRQYAAPQGPSRQEQRPQQVRAYSVVPQVGSPAEQMYRHGSVAPPSGPGMGPPRRGVQQYQQQPQQQRAVSVYQPRYGERAEDDDHAPRGPRRQISGRM
jgi:hypothetical protein